MRTFGVLLLRRRHAYHAADLSVSGQPRREYAQHAFSVEPVSLGPTRAPVYQNAGRLEHVGSDAMRRQQSVQPKPVSPGLEAARHFSAPAERAATSHDETLSSMETWTVVSDGMMAGSSIWLQMPASLNSQPGRCPPS